MGVLLFSITQSHINSNELSKHVLLRVETMMMAFVPNSSCHFFVATYQQPSNFECKQWQFRLRWNFLQFRIKMNGNLLNCVSSVEIEFGIDYFRASFSLLPTKLPITLSWELWIWNMIYENFRFQFHRRWDRILTRRARKKTRYYKWICRKIVWIWIYGCSR